MLAYAAARPTHLARGLIASVVATALAMIVPGAAAYLTYRTDRVAEFRTTSLLSLATDNSDLLAGLDRKADQGAVYVTNLLALSTAMRQEFSPDATEQPAAARFLLVSDIHGMNQYPLMREIVQTQDIDAVIDAGDLLNFGREDEGDLTGIYEGIESLGVPYIYVRGNHRDRDPPARRARAQPPGRPRHRPDPPAVCRGPGERPRRDDQRAHALPGPHRAAPAGRVVHRWRSGQPVPAAAADRAGPGGGRGGPRDRR